MPDDISGIERIEAKKRKDRWEEYQLYLVSQESLDNVAQGNQTGLMRNSAGIGLVIQIIPAEVWKNDASMLKKIQEHAQAGLLAFGRGNDSPIHFDEKVKKHLADRQTFIVHGADASPSEITADVALITEEHAEVLDDIYNVALAALAALAETLAEQADHAKTHSHPSDTSKHDVPTQVEKGHHTPAAALPSPVQRQKAAEIQQQTQQVHDAIEFFQQQRQIDKKRWQKKQKDKIEDSEIRKEDQKKEDLKREVSKKTVATDAINQDNLKKQKP